MLRRIAEGIEQFNEHEAGSEANIRSFTVIATYRNGENGKACGVLNFNGDDEEGERDHMNVAVNILLNTPPSFQTTLIKFLSAPIRRLLHNSFHALSATAIGVLEADTNNPPRKINIIDPNLN